MSGSLSAKVERMLANDPAGFDCGQLMNLVRKIALQLSSRLTSPFYEARSFLSAYQRFGYSRISIRREVELCRYCHAGHCG